MSARAVVPLDGSAVAEGMLRFIVDIAGPLDLEVVLLHVIRVLPPQVTETLRSALLETVEQNTADAREYLAPLPRTSSP